MALLCQVPYIFSFSLFMILAGLTLPRSSEYSLIYYFALWCTLVVLSTIFMLIHSLNYYAAWPHILPLTKTIHYINPGFRSDHHGIGSGVDTRPLVLRAAPYILSFALIMILAGLTLPRSSDYSLIYYFALWCTLAVLSTIFMFIHGLDYVTGPHFPPTETTHCSAPGFQSRNEQWATKGPGIRRCLKLRLATRNIFIMFDSYPHPSYRNGTGMTVSPQLSIQAEIAELRSQSEFLKSEQRRLESEIKEAEARSREQERQSSAPSSFKASTSTPNPFGPDPRSAGSSSSHALGHLDKPPTPPPDHDDSIPGAMWLQNEFDKEDRVLSAQRAELAKSTQRLFECGICMEEMPDDSIARPDPCGHTFCRECLRGHVAARLSEHRFPILCPTCTAGKGKGKEAAGEVSQSLAQNLGLTDEQYGIWTEMEMISFSVLLNCRKCQRTMFVARDEHEKAKIIVCPLPDCNHAWCKQCQQSIDYNGPLHTCDGTSELDHLMKQQGWKYCPTCKTPIQKISGCNHMSCMTPACNTHFCYICGGLIVKSVSGQEINEATSTHYAKNCVLFELPE